MSAAVIAMTVIAPALAGAWLLSKRLQKLAERAVPPAGRFADTQYARLHYIERGTARDDAPSVVMLHGLAGQLHHFAYALVDDLARDVHVIAIDRPGSGYSTRRPGRAITLLEQAAAVDELLQQLGVRRAVLVGHSLGGALSLTIALQHRSRVAALALIAPLTTLDAALPRVFAPLQLGSDLVRHCVAALIATPALLLTRKRVMPEIFGPEDVPPDYAIRAGGVLSFRPSQFVSASQDLAALPTVMHDIERRYPLLTDRDAPPVLVLYGRGDRILDATLQGNGFVARVPQAELTLIDGGHMLPITQPASCAALVRAALRRASTHVPQGA